MSKLVAYVVRALSGALILLFAIQDPLSAQYKLKIEPIDKQATFISDTLKLQTEFRNRESCSEYIDKIPKLLFTKGFAAASVDSVTLDTEEATITLYVGETMFWTNIRTDSADKQILYAVSWNPKQLASKPVNFQQFELSRNKILNYLENNGYPFASVKLDSIQIANGGLEGKLVIDKGPLYRIDSIRNMGTAKISNNFLQHYLSILNGTTYKKEKLQAISKKITGLPYLVEQQPWNLTMLGTGSILNLYLAPKKSSQVNVLIGLLPANEQTEDNKLLVTGEANVNLRNALGNGETIGLNWQQIQVKSPRLDLAFTQPYLFNSPFGIDLKFDLFKKDSSYINIGGRIGLQYSVSANQTGSIFIQSLKTNLLTVDTVSVKNTKTLPPEADVSSINLGINYQFNNTDYRFNPRSGNEFEIIATAGTRNIKKNNVIVKLTDDHFDYATLYDTFKLKSYQFRVSLKAAHHFRLGRTSTIRTALNGGWFESPNIFRNELFQIGGYKLLRGFDEESIFASQYGVATLEYRYLMGQNSFLFAFSDGGITRNTSQSRDLRNWFIGGGLGMAFETKAGIFNISYAVGKRDDLKFNLRQAKIHLGYVNYF
ncbi:BamA/TamA family outer membrane protein [Flavitalea sp.]|nr:BamA/TamA family outer membrane protein [Flavitalea sp.]